jgi:hypothetical protein
MQDDESREIRGDKAWTEDRVEASRLESILELSKGALNNLLGTYGQ